MEQLHKPHLDKLFDVIEVVPILLNYDLWSANICAANEKHSVFDPNACWVSMHYDNLEHGSLFFASRGFNFLCMHTY